MIRRIGTATVAVPTQDLKAGRKTVLNKPLINGTSPTFETAPMLRPVIFDVVNRKETDVGFPTTLADPSISFQNPKFSSLANFSSPSIHLFVMGFVVGPSIRFVLIFVPFIVGFSIGATPSRVPFIIGLVVSSNPNSILFAVGFAIRHEFGLFSSAIPFSVDPDPSLVAFVVDFSVVPFAGSSSLRVFCHGLCRLTQTTLTFNWYLYPKKRQ